MRSARVRSTARAAAVICMGVAVICMEESGVAVICMGESGVVAAICMGERSPHVAVNLYGSSPSQITAVFSTMEARWLLGTTSYAR